MRAAACLLAALTLAVPAAASAQSAPNLLRPQIRPVERAIERNVEQALRPPRPAVITSLAEIQTMLNSLGFDAGPADGVMGSRTRNAIAAFQAGNGLAADGRVTPDLALALRRRTGRE